MNLFNNKYLARKIEDIKIKGTKEYITKRKKTAPTYYGDYFSLDERGTAFLMDGYCFCVGFGLNGEILSEDIEMIDNFYRKKGVSSHIHFELTPYSSQQFIMLLQEKGYTLDDFLAVWVLDLGEWNSSQSHLKSDKVSIIKVTSKDSYEWARTVAIGFLNNEKVKEESIESNRCFISLSNSVAFLLKENETSVAGGLLAINEQLGEMFLTSTIPSHRGKMYQNLLIEERIKYAKSKGCTHLTVTTKPNNTSARNMERNGFKLAYNKVIMKSPLIN